ncbi:hypothetical protein CFBP2044_20960 [Xanthomonas hortorum pv. cynarae]|nr:hypothetical protein CFBP2044_20960 [Xanthomonas hortorum pv. cynarae]CAD0329324.1 hypothetical protein CFBP2044_20960 [Xanthomonas hortorum pv. cynarae]
MSDDDANYVANKVPGKLYGSRSFDVGAYKMIDGKPERIVRTARYIDRVFPDVEGEALAIVKEEFVLRATPTGKRQIKLLVVEDPRKVRSLYLQSFDMSDGKDVPSRRSHFVLSGTEIDDLLEIAALAKEGDFQVSGKFRIGVDQLQRLDLTSDAVRALVGSNSALMEEVLRTEVTQHDMVAVAFRRAQIKRFERLLLDGSYFDSEKEHTGLSDERLWQAFFEENQWIFGGALFLSSTGALDEGKLERTVAGASVAAPGKRADALLNSKGRIGALCFVELKTHRTTLRKAGRPYRPGTWPVSDELSSAVTQAHRTVQLAEQSIQRQLKIVDNLGNPTSSDVFLIRPRSVVVCGDLAEFSGEHGVNYDKYSSFCRLPAIQCQLKLEVCG